MSEDFAFVDLISNYDFSERESEGESDNGKKRTFHLGFSCSSSHVPSQLHNRAKENGLYAIQQQQNKARLHINHSSILYSIVLH